MPWTVSDVDRHIKGLTQKQKRQWVEVANSARKRCLAEGHDEKYCDALAIRMANGVIKKQRRTISMAELSWFPIFRGGKQIDSEGREHDGDELIEKAIKTFNPEEHEPPIVVGHPKDNAPAFGWISDLQVKTENGVKVLYAKAKQVADEFIDWLKKGLYKKRSASFYPDGRLRHVGFLGAAPPAVKGLADIKLNDYEPYLEFEEDINIQTEPDKNFVQKIVDGVVAGIARLFEFKATEEEKKAQQARAKKYGISVKQNNSNVTKPSKWANVPDELWLDPVNYRYPVHDAAHVRNAAARWAQVKPGDYSPKEVAIIEKRLDKRKKTLRIGEYKHHKEGSMETITMTEEELKAKIEEEAKKAAEKAAKEAEEKVKKEFAEKEKRARLEAEKQKITAFIEGLKKEGKVIPAWEKAGLLDFMLSLNDDEAIEFGEKKDKKTKSEWFMEFLEGLQKVVNFQEIAKSKHEPKHDKEFDDMPVDENSMKIHKKVLAFMEQMKSQGKEISYEEALDKVLEEV